MAKSKLMMAAERLNSDELNAARKYIKQKYQSKRLDLIKLFELVTSNSIDKPKESIWRKIYGSKTPYNDLKWRAITMQLNADLVEILTNRYTNDTNSELGSLIKVKTFYNKKLNKHFESSWTELEKIKARPRHSDHYYYLSKAHEIKQNLIFQKGRKHLTFEDLHDSERYNDIYYRCQKLKNGCYAIANQITLNANIELEDDFIKTSLLEFGAVIPLINLYGSIIFLFRNKEDSKLQDCQNMFVESIDEIHKEEALNILTLLMNYCIDFKINKGEMHFFHNLFGLYQLGINKEILFDKESLNPMHYKNIITVGLQTQNYEWTKSFIEQYTVRIPKEDQENAYNFNMAKVLFEQEQYQEVLELLNTVDYQNIQYMLGTKILQMKTYYELDEDQALEALIESFRVLLVRTTKIPKDLKTQYLEFLKYLKKLIYLNPYEYSDFDKFKEQIVNNPKIARKKWLLKKLELKNKKA